MIQRPTSGRDSEHERFLASFDAQLRGIERRLVLQMLLQTIGLVVFLLAAWALFFRT